MRFSNSHFLQSNCSRKNNTVLLLFSLAFKLIFCLCLRKNRKHGATHAPADAAGSIPTSEACFSLQVGSWLPPATSTCQRATPSGLPIVLGASLLARERQEGMKEKATRYLCRRTVRITRAEDEKLQRQAAIACIPVAEYMRRLFFGGRPIIARTDNQTIRELRRLGGLLKHNFALASEAHQSEVWSEMSRTLKMIQEAIDRLGHGHATQEV